MTEYQQYDRHVHAHSDEDYDDDDGDYYCIVLDCHNLYGTVCIQNFHRAESIS